VMMRAMTAQRRARARDKFCGHLEPS